MTQLDRIEQRISQLRQQNDEIQSEMKVIRRMLERLLPGTPSELRHINNKQLARHYDVDPATICRWRQRGWLDADNVLIPKDQR